MDTRGMDTRSMDTTMIAQVRRFNRTVTQRVGALDDRFLERGRPLGPARVLWEIGDAGCDARSRRARAAVAARSRLRLLEPTPPFARGGRSDRGRPQRLGPTCPNRAAHRLR